MDRLRIAILDDHPAMRAGVRVIASTWPWGEVVLEARDGVEYEELCGGQPAPDIALVDLCMPRRDGWATMQWMAEHQPGTKALAFTFDPTDDAVRRAFRCHACGVVCKDADAPEWLQALEHLRLTGRYHNAYSDRALTHTPDPGSPAALRQKATDSLSPAMLRFALAYTADAEPTLDEVSKELGVKPSTAETYRKGVRERTGAATRLAIYKFLLRFHLLRP